jgi:hypothetical protein
MTRPSYHYRSVSGVDRTEICFEMASTTSLNLPYAIPYSGRAPNRMPEVLPLSPSKNAKVNAVSYACQPHIKSVTTARYLFPRPSSSSQLLPNSHINTWTMCVSIPSLNTHNSTPQTPTPPPVQASSADSTSASHRIRNPGCRARSGRSSCRR